MRLKGFPSEGLSNIAGVPFFRVTNTLFAVAYRGNGTVHGVELLIFSLFFLEVGLLREVYIYVQDFLERRSSKRKIGCATDRDMHL